MFVTAIIAAGGRGERFGSLKQLAAIDGVTLLDRTLAVFLGHGSIDEVVVALPPELAAQPPPHLAGGPKSLRVVAGGVRRQDSVVNAFRAASSSADVIVIHDAARPFVTGDLVGRTIAAAVEAGAALAALPARDTVKRVEGGVVRRTLPRDAIYLAQTPQAFRRDVLAAALACGDDATDEAALAERAGYQIRIVEGEALNIKITTPEDLQLAEGIVRRRTAASAGRAGVGYDLHRLVAGRPLVLGGVTIPSERGAMGHSDADVVCHAAIDAILGAASLGDIGWHFPDTDPKWKDARSLELLREASVRVAERGFAIGNLDVTVVLEAPKLRAFIDQIRGSLAAALGVDSDLVSVKAKTNEGLDAVGRGEAIIAQAIALLRPV